jgi:hypothetical protein
MKFPLFTDTAVPCRILATTLPCSTAMDTLAVDFRDETVEMVVSWTVYCLPASSAYGTSLNTLGLCEVDLRSVGTDAPDADTVLTVHSNLILLYDRAPVQSCVYDTEVTVKPAVRYTDRWLWPTIEVTGTRASLASTDTARTAESQLPRKLHNVAWMEYTNPFASAEDGTAVGGLYVKFAAR